MKISKRKLFVLLIASLIANVVVLCVEVTPIIYPKLKAKYFKENTIACINSASKSLIFEASLKMAESQRVTMVWNESNSIVDYLSELRKSNSTNEFKKYNYPRAYLYYGISSFLLKEGSNENKEIFKSLFDNLIDEEGNPNFQINRVDQVPFGMASLNLYKMYGDEKYLLFSDKLYQYILKSIDPTDGIVLYREGQTTVLNDVLGMVIPFLIEYSKNTGNITPIEIAEKQLKYYITYGVDKETNLPMHAINRKKLIKVGSANWGRGIGWFYIALSHFYKETGLFKEEYQGLTKRLNSLKNSEGLWSQFPGSSDTFDASSSTLFLYGMMLNNEFYEGFQSLSKYISDRGQILQTSGDTYSINRYSNSLGKSELSQGMLLLILSLQDNK